MHTTAIYHLIQFFFLCLSYFFKADDPVHVNRVPHDPIQVSLKHPQLAININPPVYFVDFYQTAYPFFQ